MKTSHFLVLCLFLGNLGFAQDTTEIINIPVVFHVVHDTKRSKCYEPNANEDHNVSRQLILAELKDLHDDFLLLNKDTNLVIAPYKKLIANPHINFYLDTTVNADKEPGIIRVASNSRNWTSASPILDNKKRLNVYVVNHTGSYVINSEPWNTKEDCIYLYYCWIGRGYRLLTHEAGHWLGLLHLWGTGNGEGNSKSCTIGDNISDTHPQQNATDDACDKCPHTHSDTKDQSCDATPSNYNNYMDYSGCRKMFTKDQVAEMRKNLFNNRSEIVAISRNKKH